MRTSRLVPIASALAVAALLSACVSRPIVVNTPPAQVTTVPAVTTVTVPAPAVMGVEYGRVTNMEFIRSAPTRVTIQVDTGAYRTYDVPATGDLRVGDRVRVENGVIYRA